LIDPKTKTYEVCDRKSNGTVIENDGTNSLGGVERKCSDKGNYTCTDCTKAPGNSCYRCEDGYQIPKLNLINVTGQEVDNRGLGKQYNLQFLRLRDDKNPYVIAEQGVAGYNYVFTLDDGINLNDDCMDEYGFAFGLQNSAGVFDPNLVGDVFEFPKAGTSDLVYNDFIFSPPCQRCV
jgi:hypothetical protein